MIFAEPKNEMTEERFAELVKNDAWVAIRAKDYKIYCDGIMAAATAERKPATMHPVRLFLVVFSAIALVPLTSFIIGASCGMFTIAYRMIVSLIGS
jgi:hypothetical protein